MSDSTSKVGNVVSGSDNVSQDVLTVPFSAPSIVSGRSEPMPDRAPFVQYSDGLGTTLGGLAAIHAPTGILPTPACPSRTS